MIGCDVRREPAADGSSLDLDEVAAPQAVPEPDCSGVRGRRHELSELTVVNDQGDVGPLVEVGHDAADADGISSGPFILRERPDLFDGGEGSQRGAGGRLCGSTAGDRKPPEQRDGDNPDLPVPHVGRILARLFGSVHCGPRCSTSQPSARTVSPGEPHPSRGARPSRCSTRPAGASAPGTGRRAGA